MFEGESWADTDAYFLLNPKGYTCVQLRLMSDSWRVRCYAGALTAEQWKRLTPTMPTEFPTPQAAAAAVLLTGLPYKEPRP